MRRLLFYAIPLWKLLVVGGVLVLLHLAEAPGCTTNVATIVNDSGSAADVTLRMRDIVVWRGKVGLGATVIAPYRIVGDTAVMVRAELAQGSVEDGGDYVTPYMAHPELFVIEKDHVSMTSPDRDRSGPVRGFDTIRVMASCAVQLVLDLTGAPDPATLR